LLEINQEILELLERGGTLVVPSAQRAAAVRLAYTSAQLRVARRVWKSPDVLPWSAWLERGLDEARGRGIPVPRRLSRAEAWWLWREAVRAACVEFAVLAPDALIDTVQRAVLLLEDQGLVLREAVAPETTVLLGAHAHYVQRCERLHALWSASWRACADYLQPAGATRLAGFAELGPARRAWLDRIGVAHSLAPLAAERAVSMVREFEHPEGEAEAAAQWCASRLDADPAARLLVVVPRLAEQRHRWLRALTQRLDYGALIGASAAAPQEPSAVAVEGGQPLSQFELVGVALQLLALAAGETDFAPLSAVLRSAYLASARRDARLRVDLWLREQNLADIDPRRLHSLVEPIERQLGAEAASTLAELLEALHLRPDGDRPASTAPASDWAKLFADSLTRSGWPGTDLGSHEQQIRARLDELLGEFAALGAEARTLGIASAVQLLRQLAARTAFEPATDDAPVTLTASCDDPIVGYDGIWVAGLTAEAWPEAMRPDALIPWAIQRAAGMPLASPEGALRLAEQAMQAWASGARTLVLSFAHSHGDLPRDPSPLLREIGPESARPEPDAPPFELGAWLAASAPRLELWRDASGPAWPRHRLLKGGTSLLEWQGLCPFRGFALVRLAAQPLREPEPGIDPRLRGRILHEALERFWRAIPDSQALHALGGGPAVALARECVMQAIAQAQRRAAGLLDRRLLDREAERDTRLLELLLAWELNREPFAIEALERAEPLSIAGASLALRLDRIDRLADGRLIVIDYKSGDSGSFDPMAERLTQPQLPAYATAVGERTAAVAMVQLGRQGLKLRGIADVAGRLSGLRPLKPVEPDWPGLLERWRAKLAALVEEFLCGHAAVDPQPRACESCHLQPFCRIQTGLAPAPSGPSWQGGTE
jgi:ATP-dependent helicase/nuclease subunit B